MLPSIWKLKPHEMIPNFFLEQVDILLYQLTEKPHEDGKHGF